MRIKATDADLLVIYEFCVMQGKFLFLSLEKGSFPFRFQGLLQLITTALSLTSHLLATSFFCFLEPRNKVLHVMSCLNDWQQQLVLCYKTFGFDC